MATAADARGRLMHEVLMVIAAALLINFGMLINVADTVPRYDIKSTCKAAVALAAGSEGRTIESCMSGEEAAHKDLEKDWAKIPAAERSQCIGTVAVGGSPSYVELLICVEMMRDSRTHHEEEQRAAKSKKASGKS
jgi:hypothetical protein